MNESINFSGTPWQSATKCVMIQAIKGNYLNHGTIMKVLSISKSKGSSPSEITSHWC